MHPADSIRAFAALRDTGMDAEEIAARFGQAVSFVYKMLRLSALAPSLIDLIAKDQLSLEAARALTLTDDHDQQMKVAKAANGHAHTIRRMLTTEKVDTTHGAFLFVGRDAYVEKGGTITVDLFSQGAEGFADQPELVQELAEEKLDAIADEYRAIGWHEVRAQLDRPYDLYMKGSMYPATREPTEAEATTVGSHRRRDRADRGSRGRGQREDRAVVRRARRDHRGLTRFQPRASGGRGRGAVDCAGRIDRQGLLSSEGRTQAQGGP